MLARNSSSARNPASSAVRMRARSRSIQSLRRRGIWSALWAQKGGHRLGRECLGQCLGEFGPADHRHGVGRDQLRGIEKRTQHVPGRPAPLNRSGLMGFRVLRERGARGVDRDGAHRHTGQIAAAGDEGRDRVEVLAVGLNGVRRGLAGAAVSEERGEPLGSRSVEASACSGRWGMPQWARGCWGTSSFGIDVAGSYKLCATLAEQRRSHR
jgi:hypothetical protein